MANRELRRMHRAELIEIIYALKQSEDQLKAQNAALTAQLQDRTPTPPPPIPFRRRAARPNAFWNRHRQTPTA